ncbi:hypothetical protein ACIL4J_002909, partial [Enterococcus hirae]
LFKKMPRWAVTATLFIGRTLIRVGRAGKKLWNKRKENQQRAFLTQLCEGKNGSEIEKIIKADPKLAKLIEPKKRGLIGRIIDKVKGITPEARQNKWKDKLLQQPLHKFDKNLLKPLMNENEVIRDKVLSENRFLGSIDPNARKVYQATLKDTTNNPDQDGAVFVITKIDDNGRKEEVSFSIGEKGSKYALRGDPGSFNWITIYEKEYEAVSPTQDGTTREEATKKNV